MAREPFQDPPLSTTQIRHDLGRAKEIKDMGPSTGPGAFGLALAKVVNVDNIRHELTLQVFSGENDLFQRTAVPNTYPGAGARHFMGALPETGDICVIGYLSTTPRMPIILAWVPISLKSGMEWLPIQDTLPTEADMSPRRRTEFEGIFGRYRHKMRAMTPGDLYLSSSKGSDLFLDQGVQLVNRRGNELRLRDQDQALVVRALQHFEALGGVRVYSGMVQRDATQLLRRMVSDGISWDAGVQYGDGIPLPSHLLGTTPKDILMPHPVFRRTDPTAAGPDSGINFSEGLDPHTLLARALLLSPDGAVLGDSDGVEYGGKSVYRVALDPLAEASYNGAAATSRADAETLTEYRVELQHTWDGHLPVSEQTDGFDADRVPEGGALLDNKRPFLQWVLGSVVGNDPFSTQGRQLYKLPLVAKIFAGPNVEPRLESGLGIPLEEHAATLLRIESPLTPTLSQATMVSLTKDGRARVYLGGPRDQSSLDMGLAGDLNLRAGGAVRLGGRSLHLDFLGGDPVSNIGFGVKSQTGAVVLSGGGPSTAGGTAGTRPALILEAPTGDAQLSSGKVTSISGAAAVVVKDTNDFTVIAKQVIGLFSDKITQQCNTLDRTVQGKESTLYSGPRNFLPTAAPIRSVTFAATPLTGHVGGTTDQYKMVFGNREETFIKGNHSTTIAVGDSSTRIGVGTFRAQAGTNLMELATANGFLLTVPLGPVSVVGTQTVGITGLSGVTVKSGGVARLSGTTTILGGAGKVGLIICSSDLDPLSGLPLTTFGMGSPGHLLAAPL